MYRPARRLAGLRVKPQTYRCRGVEAVFRSEAPCGLSRSNKATIIAGYANYANCLSVNFAGNPPRSVSCAACGFAALAMEFPGVFSIIARCAIRRVGTAQQRPCFSGDGPFIGLQEGFAWRG